MRFFALVAALALLSTPSLQGKEAKRCCCGPTGPTGATGVCETQTVYASVFHAGSAAIAESANIPLTSSFVTPSSAVTLSLGGLKVLTGGIYAIQYGYRSSDDSEGRVGLSINSTAQPNTAINSQNGLSVSAQVVLELQANDKVFLTNFGDALTLPLVDGGAMNAFLTLERLGDAP